ncbi:MAG TPA: hypothetical protein P5123_00895 [Spirochaetota bacterium]|nr:hypothetical protein [Spirochaetota bacterium]
MRSGWKFVIMSVLVLTIFGCTSVNIQKAEVSRVKTVALVGFEMYRQTDGSTFGIVGDLVSSKKLSKNEKDLAESCYKVLTAQLGKEQKWKFVSIDKIRNNKGYGKFFKENGRASKLILNIGKRYKIDGIATPKAISDMSYEERQNLIKELGVDAIASFDAFIYQGESLSIAGFEYSKYRITLDSFEVYSNTSKDPIVSIKDLIGDTPETGHFAANINNLVKLKTNTDKGILGATSEIAKSISEEM